jgi:type I restriction enzyme R subunit
MKFNEQYTVENHVIKYVSKSLGYEYIRPEEFSKLREFENEYLVTPLLLEAIKRINNVEDEEAFNVIREIKKIDTNEGLLMAIRNGIDIIDVTTKKTINYKIVDFKTIANNQFVVTNQFYFEGSSENIRPDILIFLNGLPIVDIEAKSPTASSSVNFENAIDQIKRYEKVAWKLFIPNCFNIVTDGLKTKYGATFSAKQYYSEWREENSKEEQLEITLNSLLSKDRLLDIIENFIVFEEQKERTIKEMCRYQQMRAANKIVERIKEGNMKRGLIWHTQGSGKSLTMFFTAWKLRFAPELKNPKVFVLVDRTDLDDQIFNTFINCGGQNVVSVESKRDLAKKITNEERGIFISTVQKFNDLPAGVENDSENIVVLCDEGHRSNEGFASINLRASMKNAFFFGFTGTPIDKLTLNTHRNFGEDGERYLDYYSIQQAIDDGATLPVTYEARLSKFFVDEEKIDKQFEEITADLSATQKDLLAKKYGKKEAVVKLEKRMRAVIQDIVEHYKLYVQPNGFKAQIVCYDREATAFYKKLIDELVPAEWSTVVYSPGDRNSDSDDLKAYDTNKRQREKIIAEFKNPEHPLKFLLVCDMLLTGFDAPIEQVMYLDKPLRDHNLLQAIARTNRIYPNKGCGKIIDYYGITKNLEKSLDFDESVVDTAMINIDSIKAKFNETLDEVLRLFPGVNTEDPGMENLRYCLKIFSDSEDKQNFFSDRYNKLKLYFEILSPDPFLKNYLRKFEWITCFWLAFSKEYLSEGVDMHELAQYGQKLKDLIQEKIDYEGITKNFRELKINDMYALERLEKMEGEEKAANLEKMLKREISVNVDTDPVFKKFSERLSAIKKEFEQSQIDLAERIKRYYELLEDVKKRGGEAQDLGMNLKEYGLYVVSEEFVENIKDPACVSFVREVVLQLSSVLDDGWQESSKREEFLKDVKRIIQGLLWKEYKEKLKVNDPHKYLNRLVDIVIKKF